MVNTHNIFETIKDLWFFIALLFVVLVVEVELKHYEKEKRKHDKYSK